MSVLCSEGNAVKEKERQQLRVSKVAPGSWVLISQDNVLQVI